MNCHQARAQLAIYREQKQDPTKMPELEGHLAHCADCKAAYAQYQLVGDHIRSMPAIEPAPDARHKLMQALAAEHVRFLQHAPASATSTPTPVFLGPYLKDLAAKTARTNSLAAFSTADTGPLPIIQSTRPRRIRQTQHFAIIGLAASFMVVVMLGGLISLLLLANQGQPVVSLPSNTASIGHPEVAQADPAIAATQTLYSHVVSASTSNDTIYYSAYDHNANWMLEKFDTTGDPTTNRASTALLTHPSTRPMIILGSSENWLLWLQMEQSKATNGKQAQQSDTTINTLEGTWSLKALYMGKSQSTTTSNTQKIESDDSIKPLTLYTDNFNKARVADWVTSPIQGLSFYHNHALVSLLDSKGIAHLLNYQFAQDSLERKTEIATAKDQHVLTSPTATNDGYSIYWADEWLSTDQKLHSNIWTQQAENSQPSQIGRWMPHSIARTYVYRNDEHSFRPQLVNGTLFMLNTSTTSNPTPATPTVQATATPTSLATPKNSATPTVQASATATPQDVTNLLLNPTEVDPTVLTPQLDAHVSGKLLAFSANGMTPETTTINDNEILTGLQSGGAFLIWQNSASDFKMYDTRAKVMVNGINNINRDSAAFVSVNNTTVIWTKYLSPDNTQQDPNGESNVVFNTLKWPK
ncbi:hypothetical protein KDW_34800 [Dictyobacter vulcani]|uniref:Zinc-finger domain-containing protein n=1 Tax=Dictyobacter vulcani TaxID=2607529 RepID=A0A5J4KHS2_9CHLR|nr:hypothetical protein [Dictyobacter vulcani]GER89318.1 hypothetical protein KDW_34800 [Dictyobacter vulcani]